MSSLPSPLRAGRRLLTHLGARAGFRDEISFWQKELRFEGDSAEFVASTIDPARMATVFPNRITPYIDELQTRFSRRLRVLDVGCGPASILSSGHRLDLFDLTGVDPLADRYAVELARNNQSVLGDMRQGFGEDLAEMFEPASFDLVFMCNALDHSQSPSAVLAAMCQVLRPGGILYLQGYVREGSSNNFHGLHQHDLSLLSEGRLMCRKRAWPFRHAGHMHCLTEGHPLDLLYQTAPSEELKSHLRVVYRRR